jgi:antitoxin (DNA-binding transcriptional repressor) of toxin-antitoxin stability system
VERVLDLDTAQTTLVELVSQLSVHETVLIVLNARPVARLSALSEPAARRIPGLLRDAIEIVSEDDEHLADA